jgi:hypothetical protein
MIILSGRGRILMLGMWVGYLLIGMTVPSLIITHSYYNLFAVPVVALSLAPAGHLILTKITQQGKIWQLLATGIALVGILFSSWNVRTQLLRSYHEEVKGWIKMGNELPKGARIIGLTHDYNTRVEYYGWTALDAWPFKGDMDMGILAGGNENVNDPYWNDYFKMRAKNADYFLITTMGELDLQPLLKQNLSHYPSTSGEGYILYDLRQKK